MHAGLSRLMGREDRFFPRRQLVKEPAQFVRKKVLTFRWKRRGQELCLEIKLDLWKLTLLGAVLIGRCGGK